MLQTGSNRKILPEANSEAKITIFTNKREKPEKELKTFVMRNKHSHRFQSLKSQAIVNEETGCRGKYY